jgi:hypothetical protein
MRNVRASIGALVLLASWQLALPDSSAQPLISEIRIDQPGADVDEYLELTGPAEMDLSDYSYIVIGDGAEGSGVIEMALSLVGLAIPGDGYALLAEASFTLGPLPDLVASLNLENSDNVTHLLVSGSTATSGLDLDTDDDGSLDHTPWERMVDCVAILHASGSGDMTYCDTSVGPDGGVAPYHAYLDGGWQIGQRDPLAGIDTPGLPPAGLPVELTNLDWVVSRGEVILNWTSSGRCDCSTFRVRLLRDGSRDVVAEMDAKETKHTESDYVLPIYGLRPGLNLLDLMSVALDGTETSVRLLAISVPAADGFSLSNPYPSPTSGDFRFEVESYGNAPVDVTIYDAAGRVVKRVITGRDGIDTGATISSTLEAVAPGIYFLVAQTPGFRRVRKVVRV